MQFTENGVTMGFYTLAWIILAILIILLVFILYKLNIHGRLKRWVGKPRSINHELTRASLTRRNQYANSFAFPVHLCLKMMLVRNLFARLFNCKLTIYVSTLSANGSDLRTLEIAYCIFSYGIGKLTFVSSPMQCDLNDLAKLIEASQFKNYYLDVIVKKSTRGLSDFMEKLIIASDNQYANRCIRRLNFLIGKSSLSGVAQCYLKHLQLDFESSYSTAMENSAIRGERGAMLLSENNDEKTTRSTKLHTAYTLLCETRNLAALAGQLDINTLIGPESFVFEYGKMLDKDLFNSALCKEVFLVSEWLGTKSVNRLNRSGERRSAGFSFSAVTSYRSLSSFAMFLIVIYLGYFGWSSSSFAGPNAEVLINNMRTLESSIKNRGMRNLNTFEKHGKQLLSIRREIRKCRRCGELETSEWKKIVHAYEAEYNQYLIDNVYPRLATIANNLQSNKLAEAIYLHFKTQTEFLEAPTKSSNAFKHPRLGEIVEPNVSRQKQINFTYALFLELLKTDSANLTEYDLGESVVWNVADNNWFVRWYQNYYRSLSGQPRISEYRKYEMALFDVIDRAVSKKNHMHSSQLSEDYSSVSPRMAKWMLSMFREMTYSNKTNGKNSNIEEYIGLYFHTWFHCDTGMWKDLPADLIDLQRCGLLVGRNLHDTAILAKLILDQVLGDVSNAREDNHKEIKNTDIFLKWVLGVGSDNHATIQSMIEESARKLLKSASRKLPKELLDLGVVVRQVEYSHQRDNNWYQQYMEAVEKGENSTLAKNYLPLWNMLNSGEIARYSNTVALILERQLLSYMLNMRFSINKVVNNKWKIWVQQAEFDTISLKKFTENFQAINEKLNSIIDLDKIKDADLKAFVRFIRPDPIFNFSNYIENNDRISTLMQNDVFDFYSVPSRAYMDEKILASEVRFSCAKHKDIMRNENYKKSYQVKGAILNCEQITLKANTQTRRCEKTIKGKRAVVNEMIKMMTSNYYVDLDCGGGRQVKIDLGFRPEKDIFFELYRYFKMQVPKKIARANENEYAYRAYLIDVPKKGE